MIDIIAVAAAAAVLALLLGGGLRRFAGRSTSAVGSIVRTVGVVASSAALAVAVGFHLSRSRGHQLFGELVRRVDVAEPVVALTFDDGPTVEGGTEILDILATAGARATFFVTGSEIEANPEVARRMVAEGHQLGNHTYSHRRMVAVSLATIREEVERTDALIRDVGYGGEILFRAPYSHKLVALPYFLGRTGRTSVSYDVEPDSSPEVAADADRIVAHVRANVRPGSILLLHVMYPSRAEVMAAVPRIIRALRSMDYRFVTVSELIGEG